MRCPKCALKNLNDTGRCECGYDFSSVLGTFLRKWIQEYEEFEEEAFSGSGNLKSTEFEMKKLKNCNSKEYKTLNMQNLRVGNVAVEVLFNNLKFYNTPIVRNGKKATVGYQPESWKDWEY